MLSRHNEQLVTVPQNLYEFWAVATRRRGAPPVGQNGLWMTAEQASRWMAFFQRRFLVLHDPVDLLANWHELVKTRRIHGLRSHDVRLVAAMQCHGIARIITFNGNDFRGFGVTVVDPASL